MLVNDKTITSNIKKYRSQTDFSQSDMADALGLKERSSYAYIETGKTRILNRHLQKIADTLKVSVLHLLIGDLADRFDDESGLLEDPSYDNNDGGVGYMVNKYHERTGEIAKLNEDLQAKEKKIADLKSEIEKLNYFNNLLLKENKELKASLQSDSPKEEE